MLRMRPWLGRATITPIINIWFLVDSLGRTFLIDTGHQTSRFELRAALWWAGIRRKGDLTAVILTHKHGDHAGNAPWLRRTFDCPVCCHLADAQCLTGHRTPPIMARPDVPWPKKALCMIEDTYPIRCEVDEYITPGVWKWGFRVFETPGHTEGSTMLFHEPTATLFSGDAIVANDEFRFFRLKLRYCEPAFSEDPQRCSEHARDAIRELPTIETLCTGHGPIVYDNINQRLIELPSPLDS